MRREYLSIGVLILVLAAGACSKQPEKTPPTPAVKVGVSKVDKGVIKRRLHFSGPLRFLANTTVSAEVSAQVQSIPVADGQAVHRGQLLLIFDETKIKESAIHAASTLQKDEATLAFAKTEFEKNLVLYKSGSVSQNVHDQKLSAYENASAQVEMDRAVLAKAMEDLKKTRVKAPITGRISKRYVEKGDWVPEGGKLFQISDSSKVYLEAHLSDVDLAKLNVPEILNQGKEADVHVDSYPGRLFKGKLTYLEPSANEARLFEIRISLDNSEMLLLQGMFARGQIVFDTLEGVLRIPLTALLDQIRENDYNTVAVVDTDSKAQLRRIKIGKSNRLSAQVLEGLKEGETVVVQGKEVLAKGQLVEPSPVADSKEP